MKRMVRVPPRTICVYCASSRQCDPEYHDAAFRLGRVLAEQQCSIVYGGGGAGSMGALADGALSKGGHVVGILPRFMQELEWGHSELPELRVVEDLRTRKHLMLSASQGDVALPGGSGTLEELLEAITLKCLGLYTHPIVLVDTRNYFAPLVQLLERSVTVLPHTKVHGFGGDYGDVPEFVAGHLQIARENIAGVLARLVERRWLEEEEALQLAADWLFNNPNQFFRLGFEEVRVAWNTVMCQD